MMKRQPGVIPHVYWTLDGAHAEQVEGGMIEESLISIYVNAQEVATVMCSPLDQEALALGFLYNERMIESMDEVGMVKTNVPCTTVDIFLKRAEFIPPRRLILTSGCGGGVTFQQLAETDTPIESDFVTTPEVLHHRMRDLQTSAPLYSMVRGVHTATLAAPDRMLVSAEDVGRHNAVDKVTGKALQQGIATRDHILLTTGRISSEMLGKARRMGIPLVASRTAPTSIAVQLAEAWKICIVGYLRRDTMRVYTHAYRLGLTGIA